MSKPILLVDFDGVCHSYVSGWKGADIVRDPPVEGLEEALRKYLELFDVQIYSARTNQAGGLSAMKFFFEQHAPTVAASLKFPEQKPAAFLTIDDRAITFRGTWPDADELLAFKTWNAKEV